MSMTALAKDLQEKGRYGDTMLAHITPEEAQLLKDHGGSGTINPETGLPEFFDLGDLYDATVGQVVGPNSVTGKVYDTFKSSVKQIAPVIIPAIAIFAPELIPAIGTSLGATSAVSASVIGAAALSAGVTLAAGGNLKNVLTNAALAGASTYLTPILGQNLTPAGTSPLVQTMVGSATMGAGYVGLRGGSVKEMLAAASTGAAAAYIGNVARDGVAKINDMIASGKITQQVTDKGATDAVFLAADAANLKAAGLSENEIVKVLAASGASTSAAGDAAYAVTHGSDAATAAATIAANHTQGVYTGDANTHSITAGNNPELVQRAEDSKLLAQDATQLANQGLSKEDIAMNLKASGVNEQMANYAANRAIQYTTGKIAGTSTGTFGDIFSGLGAGQQGSNVDNLSNDIMSQGNALTQGQIYSNTTDTIARNLGEVMNEQQTKEYNALKFKDLVNNGQLTLDEASVLGEQGLTGQQMNDLIKLGYTAPEVSDLIGSGVTPDTLTTLANTKFPESQINDMLLNGVSANDISYASKQVDLNRFTTNTAEKLLNGGITGNQLTGVGISGNADAIGDLLDKGMSQQAFNKLYSASGTDWNKINTAIDNGQIDVNQLNQNVTSNTQYKQWLQSQYNNPIVPKTVTGTTTTPSGPQQVTKSDFDLPDWADNVNSVSTRLVGVVDSNGVKGIYDLGGNGMVYDLNGNVLHDTSSLTQPTQPVTPTETTQVTQPTQPVTPTETTQVTQPTLPPDSGVPLPDWAKGSGGIVVKANDGTLGVYNPSTGYTVSYDGSTMVGTPDHAFTGGGTLVAKAPTTTITDTGETSYQINVGGVPKYAGMSGAGTSMQGYEPATATDIFGPNDTNNAQNPYTSGAQLDPATNTWVKPILSTPTPVIIPPQEPITEVNVQQPTTPYIPIPTVPTTTPTVTPTVPTVTPTPTQPTTVSSSTRTTVDGSVYRDDQKSDGTVTSTLISGPTTTGTTTTPAVTPTVPQEPLSPIKQEVIPPGSSYVAPVTVTPTETTTTETKPVTKDTVTPPYVPIIQEPVTTPTTGGGYNLRWGTPPLPQIPTGLNPGWITNVPQYYHPTNQAGSQYYWGAHPYQPTYPFNPTLYNQLPNAPVQPYGLGYAQTAATAHDILGAMQGRYPLLGTTTEQVTPIKPT